MARQDQISRKMRRLPVSLPGTPSGQHVQARPGAQAIPCFCGACSNKGKDNTLFITLKTPRVARA